MTKLARGRAEKQGGKLACAGHQLNVMSKCIAFQKCSHSKVKTAEKKAAAAEALPHKKAAAETLL